MGGHKAGEDELTQLVLDFVESGPRAGFVLVTARSAGNRDAADRVIAHLDRQAAFSRADLTIKHRGIEGILVGYPLGEALRLMQSSD